MKDITPYKEREYQTSSYWEITKEKNIRCTLCPHSCVIEKGETGTCKTRKNIDGKLKSINFGLNCVSIDAIEKKPLFHWKPGSRILSIGSFGCNLFCPFCQNYHLSRSENGSGLKKFSPEDIASLAIASGLDSVAFTYNEPTVCFEFAKETSILLRSQKIAVVLVTNGYISAAPRSELFEFTDAMNIDLKGFSDETYSHLGGSLNPVLDTIFYSFDRKIHLELTHLVVPGINDSLFEFMSMVRWIKELSPDIPLHITRYFPAYKWSRASTPDEDILRRVQVASEYLKFVYTGNIGLKHNTNCPNCGKTVIYRSGKGEMNNLVGEDGKCPFCKTPLGIVTK